MRPVATLEEARLDALETAARRATSKAFLTKPGGTAYGAAVLTAEGAIHTAGQYSSFNHVTNIHAEMAAVVMATMSGQPDIVALALVSSGVSGVPARPCGVCREFLREHTQRTGREMLILMADASGSVREILSLDALLPRGWSAVGGKRLDGHPWRLDDPRATRTPAQLGFGDQIQTGGRYLSVVWTPEIWPGVTLAKVKYDGLGTPAQGREVHKLPASFSQYAAYVERLASDGLGEVAPWGQRAMLLSASQFEATAGRAPLHAFGLQRLRDLLDIFQANEVPTSACSLTGSWAVGVADNVRSDVDIVVSVPPATLRSLRNSLSDGWQGGVLEPNKASRSWQALGQFGRSPDWLVRQGRFAETFVLSTAENARCSLIYVDPTATGPLFSRRPDPGEPMETEGRVLDADRAAYKPGRYTVEEPDGSTVSVVCWHKTAGLLADGDHVRARGVQCGDGDTAHVLQVDPESHGIEWLDWAVPARA